MDFTTLQTEVQSWLIDLPSGATARVPGWVNEAIKDAAKRYNFRFMQASASYTTASLTTLLVGSPSKPADWKEARGLPYIVNQDGSVEEINYASQSELVRTYAVQTPSETSTTPADKGRPRYIEELQTGFNVKPLPDTLSGWNDGNYRIVIPYWAYPATLTATSDHNFLTDEAEYYVIYKATSLGFKWNRDEERATYYEGEAEKQYKRIERKDKLSKVPDRLTLFPNRDVYAPRPRSSNRE